MKGVGGAWSSLWEHGCGHVSGTMGSGCPLSAQLPRVLCWEVFHSQFTHKQQLFMLGLPGSLVCGAQIYFLPFPGFPFNGHAAQSGLKKLGAL